MDRTPARASDAPPEPEPKAEPGPRRSERFRRWAADEKRSRRLVNPWFWVRGIGTLAALLAVAHYAEWKQWLIQPRYYVSQMLDRTFFARQAMPSETRLVVIDDDAYWSQPLSARLPLRGDYLARLIRAIDAYNPAVIAIDLENLTRYVDHRGATHKDYEQEVRILLDAIAEVARRRTVVLPLILREKPTGGFELAPDAWGRLRLTPSELQVRFGYITLPTDVRALPLRAVLVDRQEVDSFAQAIVRARRQWVLRGDPGKTWEATTLYARDFIPEKAFGTGFVVKAREVLEFANADLAHNIVLVGGGWHVLGPGTGPKVDLHPSPIGPAAGVALQANYVEAFLERRHVHPLPSVFRISVEVASALVLIAVAGFVGGGLLISLSVVLLLGVLLGALTLVAATNFGYFFEWSVVVAGVLAHALLEDWMETHHIGS